ncbi:EthD domain-containing protein [Flavonifractor plautii]|nr:EthD domain-containing protein [Flavonifractor plautii]MCQ4721172.1 EthD domain-containing protein [Flavonifractor plautii]
MTAEEFRTRWTGHVPKVQDVTGEHTSPGWRPRVSARTS